MDAGIHGDGVDAFRGSAQQGRDHAPRGQEEGLAEPVPAQLDRARPRHTFVSSRDRRSPGVVEERMKPWMQGDRPAMHSSYTTYKVTMSGHARVVQRWRQPTLMHSVQRRRAQVDMRGLLCGATRERLLTGKLRRRWRNFQVPRGPDRRIIQCNSGRGRVGAERAARACGWHRWWLRSEFFIFFIFFFPFLFRLFFLSCFPFAYFSFVFLPKLQCSPANSSQLARSCLALHRMVGALSTLSKLCTRQYLKSPA